MDDAVIVMGLDVVAVHPCGHRIRQLRLYCSCSVVRISPHSKVSKILVWRCASCGAQQGKVGDVEIKKLKAFAAKAGWCARPLVLHENGGVHVVYNGSVHVAD
jgi:hypothetical protein